jgi:hypothetical protein
VPNVLVRQYLTERLAKFCECTDKLPLVLGSGTVFAVAPTIAPSDRILDFRSGWPPHTSADKADWVRPNEVLGEFICLKFGGLKRLQCYLQDPYHTPADPPSDSDRLVGIGDRFYAVIGLADCNAASIAGAIREFTEAWTFFLFVSDEPVTRRFEDLAMHSHLIIAGAYDGDGYIGWTDTLTPAL